MKLSAHMGFKASRMLGICTMRQAPSRPMATNHTSMMGPNSLPTAPVPRDWIMKSAASTTTDKGTIKWSSVCETTPTPSMAESTEIAGVIMLSP